MMRFPVPSLVVPAEDMAGLSSGCRRGSIVSCIKYRAPCRLEFCTTGAIKDHLKSDVAK